MSEDNKCSVCGSELDFWQTGGQPWQGYWYCINPDCEANDNVGDSDDSDDDDSE